MGKDNLEPIGAILRLEYYLNSVGMRFVYDARMLLQRSSWGCYDSLREKLYRIGTTMGLRRPCKVITGLSRFP